MGHRDEAIIIRIGRARFPRIAGTLILAAVASTGCRTSPPEPVVVDQTLFEGDTHQWRGRLNAAEQAALHEAMDELTIGAEPESPPRPADRPRWADVPLALEAACEEMEMAVIHESCDRGIWRFELRTLDARPGRFVVRRAERGGPHEIEATIGWFKCDETALVERLIEAFESNWQWLADQPRFDEPID